MLPTFKKILEYFLFQTQSQILDQLSPQRQFVLWRLIGFLYTCQENNFDAQQNFGSCRLPVLTEEPEVKTHNYTENKM